MFQFLELQHIFINMKLHGLSNEEINIVSSIIGKYPNSWRVVKNSLKHKKKEITLVNHAQHLQVELNMNEHES